MNTVQTQDLKSRLDEIDRARRHVGHAVDASGSALRRTLQETGDVRSSRPAVILILVTVVLLAAAIVQLRRQTGQAAGTGVAVKASTVVKGPTVELPSNEPASQAAPPALTTVPIHHSRACDAPLPRPRRRGWSRSGLARDEGRR